ncbi:MAG: hypothetical protein LC793_06340 [Thermomicrobia bacterium]|nr:hypothetical protein [Thermomicrobia bacterium]
MTKRESDDAMKAAEYNIDAAFDVLRTALTNPEGLEYLPSGSKIVPLPSDEHDPEVRAANRKLIDGLSAHGHQVITLQVISAQVTITPDGGLFIGQTYFTPVEAAELGKMIQLAGRPMPGNIGIEFTSDGHVVALRPLFKRKAAEKVHPLVLEDHPEIPRTDSDPRSHAPAHTFEKLNGVVKPILAM